MATIKIIQGDITWASVDVIVNAANSRMFGGGGAYKNSIDLALSHGCGSIAFPAIPCGVFGYPPQEAAQISVSICKRPEYEALIKFFYLFSDDMVNIWMDALKS